MKANLRRRYMEQILQKKTELQNCIKNVLSELEKVDDSVLIKAKINTILSDLSDSLNNYEEELLFRSVLDDLCEKVQKIESNLKSGEDDSILNPLDEIEKSIEVLNNINGRYTLQEFQNIKNKNLKVLEKYIQESHKKLDEVKIAIDDEWKCFEKNILKTNSKNKSVFTSLNEFLGRITQQLEKINVFGVSIIPVVSALAWYIITLGFKNQCKEFYGVNLDCFDVSVLKERFLVIGIILGIGAISFLFPKKYFNDIKTKGEQVVMFIIFCFLVFAANLLVFIKVLQIPVVECLLLKLTYECNIFITVFLIVLVLLFSVSVVYSHFYGFNHMRKMIQIIIFFSMISELLISFIFVFQYSNMKPSEITEYTVVTIKEDVNDVYIVIGEYNECFVCQKVVKVNGEDISVNNSVKNECNVKLDKSSYIMLSYDEITKFETIKFNTVLPINNESRGG